MRHFIKYTLSSCIYKDSGECPLHYLWYIYMYLSPTYDRPMHDHVTTAGGLACTVTESISPLLKV